MNTVYFYQSGVWMYAGSVVKKYKVGDIIKLKRVFYPLKVIKIGDNKDIYCELVMENNKKRV